MEKKGHKETRARKHVSAVLAVVLAVTVVGTASLGAGMREQSAADTEKADKAVPQAVYGGDKLPGAEEDPREEKEKLFPAGDYSGRVNENGADSDGIKLPAPGEEESLYIGYGELAHVGMTKAALILSADGTKVHDLVIFLKDFDNQIGGGALSGISSIQTSNTKEMTLPVKDEPFGESTLLEITAEGDVIHIRIDFSFKLFAGIGSNTKLIHVGETEYWMKKAG